MNLFLTPIGQSKLTQSLANPNEPLVFSKMVIGDWNGDDLSPLDKNRTVLTMNQVKKYIAILLWVIICLIISSNL